MLNNLKVLETVTTESMEALARVKADINTILSLGLLADNETQVEQWKNVQKLTQEENDALDLLPADSIIGQYKKLADFEGCQMNFTDDFIDLVAKMAYDLDIGARGVSRINLLIAVGVDLGRCDHGCSELDHFVAEHQLFYAAQGVGAVG